jgi:hypothetical protein
MYLWKVSFGVFSKNLYGPGPVRVNICLSTHFNSGGCNGLERAIIPSAGISWHIAFTGRICVAETPTWTPQITTLYYILYPLYSGYLNHSLELVPTSLSFLRWRGQAAVLILGFAGETLPASVLWIAVFPQQCRRSVHQRKTIMALLGLPGGWGCVLIGTSSL